MVLQINIQILRQADRLIVIYIWRRYICICIHNIDNRLNKSSIYRWMDGQICRQIDKSIDRCLDYIRIFKSSISQEDKKDVVSTFAYLHNLIPTDTVCICIYIYIFFFFCRSLLLQRPSGHLEREQRLQQRVRH